MLGGLHNSNPAPGQSQAASRSGVHTGLGVLVCILVDILLLLFRQCHDVHKKHWTHSSMYWTGSTDALRRCDALPSEGEEICVHDRKSKWMRVCVEMEKIKHIFA